MKLKVETKRVLAIVLAIVGCGVAWGCLTKDQAAALSTALAAILAAWMPQDSQ